MSGGDNNGHSAASMATGPEKKTTLVLVSCGRKKRGAPSKAEDLYSSPLFAESKLYAKEISDKWYIISAKYGLLEPDETIEPYDVSLSDKTGEERKGWAAGIYKNISNLITPNTRVVLLGGKLYADPLKKEFDAVGVKVETPLIGMSIGKRLAWLSSRTRQFKRMSHDTGRLYELIFGLHNRNKTTNGIEFGDVDFGSLPKQGVYFFVDKNERGPKGGPRIVRIGTHGVSSNSKSTLSDRLREHFGTKDGYGNHRSSIFRQYAGWAHIKKAGLERRFPEWNGATSDREVLEKEKEIEMAVSKYIRNLDVFFLNVPGVPGPDSDRSYIEKNSIALLSSAGMKLYPTSGEWLGMWSDRRKIAESGLWNVDYTFTMYDDKLVDFLELFVKFTANEIDFEYLKSALGRLNENKIRAGFRHPLSQQSLIHYSSGEQSKGR